MKYMFVLFAVVIVALALVAPNHIELFPERPYTGAYAGN